MIVYAGWGYFLSNHTAVYMLFSQRSCLKLERLRLSIIAKVTFITQLRYRRHESVFEVIRIYTRGEGPIDDNR